MSKNFSDHLIRWTGVCLIVLLAGCAASLRDAKHFLVQGQEFSRSYSQEEALASYKTSRQFAEKSIAKHPSAQAYVVKGMSEINLELWEEAVKSFRAAFSFGFEKGEEWAEWVSLYGLGLSMERLGLERFALQAFEYLLVKSRLRSINVLAAQKYSEFNLQLALLEKGKEREKILRALLKKVESLSQKDLSCGYFHYILSQIFGHLADHRKSFEEAVVARELDLPTIEIFRDNDLQIVFCFQKLQQELSGEDWKKFLTVYNGWIVRWGWAGPETPEWKHLHFREK